MSIALDQVTKHYGTTPVVNDVSLDIGEGEFFVLLGPSGSGKSTLLRSIAGLVGIESGRIALHGRDITHLPARLRGVGFVFQNYALFRHLTVAENIEFALRVQGVRTAERRARRAELLRLVALEGMDQRLPSELSGGQQQRVAVARALAHRPGVLLMDEPFGALDARIRDELRRTIRTVQRELGITTVLVTHDQEEAFALGDRIGVMHDGRLLECGPPAQLYEQPRTRFVATFLGAANLLLGRDDGGALRAAGHGAESVVVVRPEDLELAATREALQSSFLAEAEVVDTGFTGPVERVALRVAEGQLAFATPDSGSVLQAARPLQKSRRLPLQPGARVAVGLWRGHALPTPISSFSLHAPDSATAEALRSTPLLSTLIARMRARVDVVAGRAAAVPPAFAARGVAVFPADASDGEWQGWLSGQRAPLLLLPASAGVPQHVLVHWLVPEARGPALACAASLLRHMPAVATCVAIVAADAPDAERAAALRSLIDARLEARQSHGLETHTELLDGEPAVALPAALAREGGALLVLGVAAGEGAVSRASTGALRGAHATLLVPA